MWVLITNCAMRSRSGTEVVTLELALGLLRRGHEVAMLTALIGRPPPFSGTKGSWSPIARKASVHARHHPWPPPAVSSATFVASAAWLRFVIFLGGRSERPNATGRRNRPDSGFCQFRS